MDQKRVPEGWDKEKALAEGVRLNVKRAGAGHPLLMFHGGMGSWTHWVRNIDVLAEHFEVRAIDAPSYGESEQVDYGLTPQEYLQVAIASVNRIVKDDESFSIVGFSFGGAIGSVTRAKQKKLIKCARAFLVRNPAWATHPCRFDVIAYDANGGGQPQWFQAAFD